MMRLIYAGLFSLLAGQAFAVDDMCDVELFADDDDMVSVAGVIDDDPNDNESYMFFVSDDEGCSVLVDPQGKRPPATCIKGAKIQVAGTVELDFDTVLIERQA